MNDFFKKLSLFHYNIGFFDYEPNTLLQEKVHIRWMKHPYKNRFFADPFILDVTQTEVKVLVEEFLYDKWKGNISLLTVGRDSFELKSRKTLLDLETHLSFPLIYRTEKAMYVIPENSASRKLNAYRYDKKTENLHFESTLIEQPVIDPVIIQKENYYILFGSLKGKNENSDLFTWQSKELLKGYTSCCNTPVKEDSNCSRRGGEFFCVDNELYSAVQCCAHNYGESLHICKVEEISKNKLIETTVNTLLPDKYYNEGLHTFNHYKDVCSRWSNLSISAFTKTTKKD